MNEIILASTSIYRKQLFEKLGVHFTTEKPDYDEDQAKQQALSEYQKPLQIAELLSKGKAQSLVKRHAHKDVLIIAGDQLVHFQGEIIGKSLTFENAFKQLKKMNNHSHELITAVTVMTKNEVRHLNHVTILKMKDLSDSEITRYIHKDKPFDCAGSYKIEESGVVLFSKIDCSDFTAIQGLPLIWVSTQMKELGYEFFKR